MRKAATYHTNYRLPSLTGRGWGWVSWVCCILLLLVACRREPELHLFPTEETKWFKLPVIDLNLEVVWNYETAAGMNYDWKSEWYYGWDDEDRRLFGELGYTEPTEFCLRRYYTSNVPKGPHTSVRAHTVTSNPFVAQYNWGFWDLLAWNNIHTIDGVQNKSLDGFKYDYERMIYVKELTMTLEPVTYIYLTQVILHNNRGRIAGIDGSANLSGLSRSVTLNTGYTGSDPITVHFGARMKRDCRKQDELVDIIGGRLVTFGICNSNGFRTVSRQAVVDNSHHYLDVSMQFNNGNDSTLVFDVTEQVRQRFKGGVITVELDVDTIPIPSRRGGSGFDAVVKDFEEETHEFEM